MDGVRKREHRDLVGGPQREQEIFDGIHRQRHGLPDSSLHLRESLTGPIKSGVFVRLTSLHLIARDGEGKPRLALVRAELKVVHCRGRVHHQGQVQGRPVCRRHVGFRDDVE